MNNVNMTIIDGNNWFRRKAEGDVLGTPVRTCFREINRMCESGLVILVWDGFKALEPRRALYPEYKMKRTSPGESFYESQKLFSQIAEFTSAIQIKVDGFEGDDVVAAVANKYRKDCSIRIESNDADLCQLGLPIARNSIPDEPHWIALMKTMVGDASDNIPGAKGFGKGAWEKLTSQQKDTLHQIVASGHQMTEEAIREKVQDFYPKSALNWFVEVENRNQLLTYYKIVNFIPIPWDVIEKNMKPGVGKPELADPILAEFML